MSVFGAEFSGGLLRAINDYLLSKPKSTDLSTAVREMVADKESAMSQLTQIKLPFAKIQLAQHLDCDFMAGLREELQNFLIDKTKDVAFRDAVNEICSKDGSFLRQLIMVSNTQPPQSTQVTHSAQTTPPQSVQVQQVPPFTTDQMKLRRAWNDKIHILGLIDGGRSLHDILLGMGLSFSCGGSDVFNQLLCTGMDINNQLEKMYGVFELGGSACKAAFPQGDALKQIVIKSGVPEQYAQALIDNFNASKD